jgi:hypothetical protein
VRQRVRVYHVDWNVAIDLTVQPQLAPYDYARDRLIRYEFFLESYQQGPMPADGAALAGEEPQGLLQRIQLQPGMNNEVDIRVFSADLLVPAQDGMPDGPSAKYGPQFTRAPATDALSDMSLAEFLNDIASGTPALQPDAPNRFLKDMARIKAVVGDGTWAVGPPQGFFGKPQQAETTVGYSLGFGPQNDIRHGYVSFRCWNVQDYDLNVGALYLVVEETPPFDPETKIRTICPSRSTRPRCGTRLTAVGPPTSAARPYPAPGRTPTYSMRTSQHGRLRR